MLMVVGVEIPSRLSESLLGMKAELWGMVQQRDRSLAAAQEFGSVVQCLVYSKEERKTSHHIHTQAEQMAKDQETPPAQISHSYSY